MDPDLEAATALGGRLASQISSGRQQVVADTLATVAALEPGAVGWRAREAFVERGGLAALCELVAAPATTPTAHSLLCKAVNALGNLAAHEGTAQLFLSRQSVAAKLASAVTAAQTRATLEAVCALQESDDEYAQGDASFCLGALLQHAPPADRPRWLARLGARTEALFLAAAPKYSTGPERTDNVAIFTLVLLQTLHTAAPDAALRPDFPSLALVEAVMNVAAKSDDASVVELVCAFLHTVTTSAGPLGQTVLLQAKIPARLMGLVRRHPTLRPTVRAVISAVVARNASASEPP